MLSNEDRIKNITMVSLYLINKKRVVVHRSCATTLETIKCIKKQSIKFLHTYY